MKPLEKITYEIDPHNRLIAKKTDKASGVTRYRHILDGRFKIDKDNSLSYHIKKSADFDTPQQVKLSGNYSLDEDRNLVLTLNKWSNQVEGNRLIIKGGLLDAKDDELSFSVGTRDSRGNTAVYILKLAGAWRADEYNRLSFNVARETGAADNLTLEGAWKINDNNEIIYTHTKFRLKTREDIANTLTFKGHWDVTKKQRIVYVLNKKIGSGFEFSGKWKLSDKSGLFFEVPFKGRKVQSIVFGATCKLSENDTLDFKLKTGRGEDLETSLKLSRKILKDQGEAFVQALREGKELSLLAGIGFRW